MSAEILNVLVYSLWGACFLIGGILGVVLGFAFAQYVSRSVFSSSISLQPALVPVTILVSILVTGLACYFPVRSATEVDPALVLKGE